MRMSKILASGPGRGTAQVGEHLPSAADPHDP
jgi:hypothetical protein